MKQYKVFDSIHYSNIFIGLLTDSSSQIFYKTEISINTFYTRKWPKKSLKKIENPKLRAWTAHQVVSDSKLNVEHDAYIHFAQKPWEMP